MFMKSVLLAFFFSFFFCQSQDIKKPKIEFRGVWIATVVNIDWPKKADDVDLKKKADFLTILDHYKALNFNAVVVQIRTAGDAFYPSNLSPISKYLTGNEGKFAENNFDYLKWMISESHLRGFEFHAWFNPYRATFDLNTAILSPKNDYFVHNDWMIKYGTKFYYNPGLPAVQNHLTEIIAEVVKNYDIDAVHFDDYFYPYKIEKEVFNDKNSFELYGIKNQNIDDWRRSNVDSLMKKVHFAIKKEKKNVQFGISPFGVWRNKSQDTLGSDSQAGQTNYDDLYADPKIWMKNKWIDYIVPQLYWSLDFKKASHRKLMEWWSTNTENANLFIGNGTYKINNDKDIAWKNKQQIPLQIELARLTKNVQGNVFFSAESLINKNKEVVKLLKKVYNYESLPPSSPNFEKYKPQVPIISEIIKNNNFIEFKIKNTFTTNFQYIIVEEINKEASNKILLKKQISIYDLETIISINELNFNSKKIYSLYVFDQNALESKPFIFTFDKDRLQIIPMQ